MDSSTAFPEEFLLIIPNPEYVFQWTCLKKHKISYTRHQSSTFTAYLADQTVSFQKEPFAGGALNIQVVSLSNELMSTAWRSRERTPDTFQKWKLDQEKGKCISSPCSVTLGHLWPHVRHFPLQASVSPLLKEEVDRVMLRSYSYMATTRECSLSGQAQCDSPKTFTSKETDWDWNQSNYKACAPITVPSWCPMPCDFMKECLF